MGKGINLLWSTEDPSRLTTLSSFYFSGRFVLVSEYVLIKIGFILTYYMTIFRYWNVLKFFKCLMRNSTQRATCLLYKTYWWLSFLHLYIRLIQWSCTKRLIFLFGIILYSLHVLNFNFGILIIHGRTLLQKT
jgi:hypothetical protein